MSLERNSGLLLWQRLLADSEHRTDRPEEADYFWVPVYPLGSVSSGLALLGLEYVRHSFPWFNATTGNNHIVAFGYDYGPCHVAGVPLLQERAVLLGKFGLTNNSHSYYMCRCPLCGPAYRPGTDLLVPDISNRLAKRSVPHTRLPPRPGAAPGHQRTVLLFFGGHKFGYLREHLFETMLSDPGFAAHVLPPFGTHAELPPPGAAGGGGAPSAYLISDSVHDIAAAMQSAVFCLEIGAAGYSTRYSLAISQGCVPVVVGDTIAHAWDEVLPPERYSVRLSEAEFKTRLPEALAAITPARVAELQAGLACVWRFFTWSSIWGASADESGRDDAWNMTMEVLRARLPGQPPVAPPCEGAPLPPGAPPPCRVGLCTDGLATGMPFGNAWAPQPPPPPGARLRRSFVV